MFFLMDFEFTKNAVTPVILLFANSNNCLEIRICSRAANLLKVPPTPSQAGKSENLCRNPFILKITAA